MELTPSHDDVTDHSSTIQTLDTMTFPLHGARLIEASAGTGKTFTIAGLYLRLLLGHGDDVSRHAVPLRVDQILVVTFTEAATAELRERIRDKIHQARLAFARGHSDDVIITALLGEFGDHTLAQKVLLDAERQIDEAAIFTIHGFCQRVLTQNAFESGMPFESELLKDEAQQQFDVVCDYWRQHFYPLSQGIVANIKQHWSTPQALLKDVIPFLSGQLPLFSRNNSVITEHCQLDLEQVHEDNIERIEQIKTLWQRDCGELEAIIRQSGVDKRTYSSRNFPNWLNAVSDWAQSETQNYAVPEQLSRFSQEMLIEKTTKGEVPTHATFTAIDEFLANQTDIKAPLIMDAVHYCRQKLVQLKREKQWLSFDDLLTRLSSAIEQDEEGILAERIRQQYPVAMIDEFQDTDPCQYHIFSSVYLNCPDTTALVMIGDPKQAIYAFRGADIFTYMKAKKQVNSHYTLGTNWRSSAEMVTASNQIFLTHSSPFLYDNDIPFYPVQPNPNAHRLSWSIAQQPQKALNLWLLDEERVSNGDYQARMSEHTAAQIHHILSSSQQEEAHFHKGEVSQPISANDIAILVRSRHEAMQVKQALSEQGIASVYLSNRDSVYNSHVAGDIYLLLNAVLEAENERKLRAGLATNLIGLSLIELDQLNNDEALLESMIEEFKGYRDTWERRGVLPMLRSLMVKRHIPEQLLSLPNGERILTDLMHLGEILQRQSQDMEGMHGLVRWFSEKMEEAYSEGDDETIQRLESERNLVQIVTIHKSKGLEYKLVFLPFILSYHEAKQGSYYDEVRQKTIYDFDKSESSLEYAEKERLAEDLRLLYVALTRSVYGCFIGLAPLQKGRSSKGATGVHLSALGYLLQQGQEGDQETLTQAVAQFITSAEGIAECPIPESPNAPYQALVPQQHNLAARQLQQSIESDWYITSYSSLVRQSHAKHQDTSMLTTLNYDLDSLDGQDEHHVSGKSTREGNVNETESDNVTDLEDETPELSIFTFPKGSKPGTFLHTVFERVNFNAPATSEENTEILTGVMEWERVDIEWLPILQTLVDTVLSASLGEQGIQLNQKRSSQMLIEMEFNLPISQLNSVELNPILQAHDPLSKQAGLLDFRRVQGMLKGFIDLIFEHQGQFYVLDWKSNHLGDHSECYQTEHLERVMIEHRYDFQYQLYSLALHRYLKTRIADYDYDRDFGGVFYLFLRGIEAPSLSDTERVSNNISDQQGVFFCKPSRKLIELLDALISLPVM
ncbi:exodeoxyribonuclease V subunit beta [Vibrio sp.]|nr:exodeoxyribonuclease V subunit beta [Vibrio sp.]